MKKKNTLQYIENINKNIFNNELINVSHHTRVLLFQNFPYCHNTLAPILKSVQVLPSFLWQLYLYLESLQVLPSFLWQLYLYLKLY